MRWRRVVLLTLMALGPSVLRAQSVLTFPRVVSTSGSFTGIAVGNPTPAQATVTLTAYLHDGSLVSSAIANPVTLRIPAGGQHARLFTELFGSIAFDGWVQATSATSGLTGFALNGNSGLTDLDGVGSPLPASESLLPLVAEYSVTKTEITVVNANNEAASVTLSLYSTGGGSLASKTVSVPSR